MRVQDPKGPVRPVPALTAPRAVDAPGIESVDARQERVTTEESEKVKVAAAEVRARAASDRSARLAQIEAAVRNGTYHPDPRRIAERILQAAALDAQLAALSRDVP